MVAMLTIEVVMVAMVMIVIYNIAVAILIKDILINISIAQLRYTQ